MKLPINRRWRVLVRRHGPASAVWRRRIAIGVGAVSIGLVALLFARLADNAGHLFDAMVGRAWWLPIIITPLGFILISLTTRLLAPEAAGSGIPQVIAAAYDPNRAGRMLISVKAAVLKCLFTVAALGCGASVGREGPTVQILAAILAWYHRLLRVPLRSSSIIAGGAAGVAAAFNTPLAGVTFAIEELADAYEQRVALLVMTTILIAGIVSLGLAGDYVYFGAVGLTLPVGAVLRVAPVAGVLGGVTGGLFARAMLNIGPARDRWLPFMKKSPYDLGVLLRTSGRDSGRGDRPDLGDRLFRSAIDHRRHPRALLVWPGQVRDDASHSLVRYARRYLCAVACHRRRVRGAASAFVSG